jgi:hypothetical protein
VELAVERSARQKMQRAYAYELEHRSRQDQQRDHDALDEEHARPGHGQPVEKGQRSVVVLPHGEAGADREGNEPIED